MSRPARIGLPVAGALFLGPLVLGQAGAAAAAGGNGQVCMGVVVDAGPNSSETNWYPVAVLGASAAPGSTSDLDALSQVGYPPSTNSAGLVCAIRNFPDNGVQNCLRTADNGQYYYWSYWQGDPYTNTWTYANSAPASHTLSSGQTYVEGWRYQDPGPDNPTATKPSVSPSAAFAQACPGVTPVPPGGSGGGSGSGGSGGGGATGSGGGSTGPAVSPGAPTPTTAVTGTGSGPRTAGGGTSAAGGGTTTTSHPAVGTGAPPGTNGDASSTTTTSTGVGAHHSDPTTASALAHVRGTNGGGGVPVLPIALVATVILVFGALAWWRWGRRPLEE